MRATLKEAADNIWQIADGYCAISLNLSSIEIVKSSTWKQQDKQQSHRKLMSGVQTWLQQQGTKGTAVHLWNVKWKWEKSFKCSS